MKPHLAYINNSLIKKKLAMDAYNPETDYERYRIIAERALEKGVPVEWIINSLEDQIIRMGEDEREGDSTFQQGLINAKDSCINAIKNLIQELKEKNNE